MIILKQDGYGIGKQCTKEGYGRGKTQTQDGYGYGVGGAETQDGYGEYLNELKKLIQEVKLRFNLVQEQGNDLLN